MIEKRTNFYFETGLGLGHGLPASNNDYAKFICETGKERKEVRLYSNDILQWRKFINWCNNYYEHTRDKEHIRELKIFIAKKFGIQEDFKFTAFDMKKLNVLLNKL